MNLPQHHLMLEGEQRGPFTVGQLRSMWSAGTINATTLHFTDGYTEWHPLEFIIGELDSPALPAAPQPIHIVAAPPPLIRVAKSRGIYILLALFLLGLFGAHNFYAGRYGVGTCQLLITLLTGWLFLPLVAVAVWVILECLIVTKDGSGHPMS